MNNPGSKMANLHIYLPASQGRQAVENLIATVFHKKYEARISDFMPILLSLQVQDRIAAIVGIRPAEKSNLFLEPYLDQPLLHELNRCGFSDLSRTEIAEVGNLVSSRAGSSLLLFMVLTKILFVSGYKITICTATKEVVGLLTKLQLPISPICKAEQGRLAPSLPGKPKAEWGSYYTTNPWVLAIDVRKAMHTLDSQAMLARWLSTYDGEITQTRCYL